MIAAAVLLLAVCVPGPSTATVPFDDHGTGLLSGEYPAGKVSWPSGPWMVSGPWQQFTTNSLSFTNSSTTSGTLTLMQARTTITSVRAYNGGGVSSTVTLACAPNPTITSSVAAGATVTITTGWTQACTAATLTSSNAWNTNFDDLQTRTDDAFTPTPTIKWEQLDHSNTEGFRVYWKHPEDATWLGSIDLPFQPGDEGGFFYPGIDLDYPIQRLVPTAEQGVEVDIMVTAYNTLTPPGESNPSAPVRVCMPFIYSRAP